MARRRKLPRFEPDAIEGLLEGRATATLDRLLELVRGTNPTRRSALDPDEARRRYALKARLQSLVIACHGASLVVVATRTPGVVALRLAGRRGDACHAVVAALEPPARAWVEAGLQRPRCG